MEDPEIVAAVVAGLPAGLAAAYDRYGAGLYAYCCMKLEGPADAEGPVEDTFIAAAAELRKLRDRSELRPWLFAVARNECVRRRRARKVTLDALIGTGGTASNASAGISDLGAAAEHGGLRGLVEVALSEMSPGNREILELDARHGLHGADLARAFGVSPGAADGMTSRARSQFEVLLGTLLELRTGRAACAELTARLAREDVDPPAVDAHIRQCAVCSGGAHTEYSPAELLALVLVTEPPAGLRARILGLADDASQAGIARRDQVARRAGPFRADGFPARARYAGRRLQAGTAHPGRGRRAGRGGCARWWRFACDRQAGQPLASPQRAGRACCAVAIVCGQFQPGSARAFPAELGSRVLSVCCQGAHKCAQKTSRAR